MATQKDRYLAALPRGNNSVLLAWRLLAEDKPAAPFRVERRNGTGWERVSDNPITDSTTWLDTTPQAGRYEYRVVDPEGRFSESITADSGSPATVIVQETPLAAPAESMHHLAAGDLLNNGRMGFIAVCRQEGQLHLDAYGPDGRHRWRRPLGLPSDIKMGHDVPPYLAWDCNHDGRTEVVTMTAKGCWDREIEQAKRGEGQKPAHSDPDAPVRPGTRLTALDGETGETVWETPWPGMTMHAHLTLAYTRGRDRCPALAIHDGRPYGESRLYVMDGKNGSYLWQAVQARPTGHNLDAGDIDEDGIQEIINGGVCYNGDGTVRWEAEPFGHTDISKPCRIDPARPGMQIWYAVETGTMNPGVYLVDAGGTTIFKEPFRHAHYGWIACHTGKVPGLQPHTAEDARAGDVPWAKDAEDAKAKDRHSRYIREQEHFPIFLPDGTHWQHLTDWQRKNFVPVQWDQGREVAFVIRKDDKRVVKLGEDGTVSDVPGSSLPAGGSYGRNLLCMDVRGDFRENIITVDKEKNTLMVLMNPNPASERRVSPCEDFRYCHDRSQTGSGYYIYLSPPYTW